MQSFCALRYGIRVNPRIARAEQKPLGGHAIVSNQAREPRHLKDVPAWILLKEVQIAAVDAVAASEGLHTTDNPCTLQLGESLKEADNDGFTFGILHRAGLFDVYRQPRTAEPAAASDLQGGRPIWRWSPRPNRYARHRRKPGARQPT